MTSAKMFGICSFLFNEVWPLMASKVISLSRTTARYNHGLRIYKGTADYTADYEPWNGKVILWSSHDGFGSMSKQNSSQLLPFYHCVGFQFFVHIHHDICISWCIYWCTCILMYIILCYTIVTVLDWCCNHVFMITLFYCCYVFCFSIAVTSYLCGSCLLLPPWPREWACSSGTCVVLFTADSTDADT